MPVPGIQVVGVFHFDPESGAVVFRALPFRIGAGIEVDNVILDSADEAPYIGWLNVIPFMADLEMTWDDRFGLSAAFSREHSGRCCPAGDVHSFRCRLSGPAANGCAGPANHNRKFTDTG